MIVSSDESAGGTTLSRVRRLFRTRSRRGGAVVPAHSGERHSEGARGFAGFDPRTPGAPPAPEAAAEGGRGGRPATPQAAGPRILILSASAGVGHLRAAEALELVVRQMCPRAHVVNVDVLDLTNAAYRHLYGRSYFDLVRNAPHLIGYLYDRFDKPVEWTRMDKVRARLQRLHFGRVVDLIESRPWDLAINTHFLPAEVIGSLREAGRVDFPQVTVTTDFYVHAMWVKRGVDRYYAASDESAVNLSAYVPAADIEVTGIPVHPAFAGPLDRDACRRKHGLATDGDAEYGDGTARRVVLQLAGGFGVGPMEQVHRGILGTAHPLHVVVAAGRNDRARATIESIPLPPRHRRTVLGFTSEMHELMAAADLIVSKPGGLTTSEALATGTPMVVVDPIPGQEGRNSDFVLEHGAAVKANTFTSLPYKLESVLGNPARLAGMADAARRIGRPRAAYDVVRHALSLIRPPVDALP